MRFATPAADEPGDGRRGAEVGGALLLELAESCNGALQMREKKQKEFRAEREAVAKHVKERYCYTCPDIVKEFGKYDAAPGKWIKEYVGPHPRTKDRPHGTRPRRAPPTSRPGIE